MKTLITIFGLLCISSTTFASQSVGIVTSASLSECRSAIIEAARTKLYLTSKSFRVRSVTGEVLPGNIRTDTVEIKRQYSDGGLTATMEGNIINGIFIIDVTVNNDCSIKAVEITDNGEY